MPSDIDEWVERQIAKFPPLSQATRDRLAALLAGQPARDASEPTPDADRAA